jgi:hypothetical protein
VIYSSRFWALPEQSVSGPSPAERRPFETALTWRAREQKALRMSQGSAGWLMKFLGRLRREGKASSDFISTVKWSTQPGSSADERRLVQQLVQRFVAYGWARGRRSMAFVLQPALAASHLCLSSRPPYMPLSGF